MKVAAHFVARWQVFWATSYTFDLSMFDGFWFSRLGDPPLNATILADASRLARVWDDVPINELWRLRRVNRDYLVRGVNARGAFHPKTYFFANERDGVLLVGSGNLGARGLDEGKEVFCQFDSRNEEGLATLRAWRDWIDALVAHLDDLEVAARWADAKRRAAWLGGASGSSPFVSNWDRSLIDQICDGVSAPVDDLHVMAPFYDEHASALALLVDRMKPRAITLYACAGMSVDGASLQKVLVTSGAAVTVVRSDEFVHAKLIGLGRGDHSRLLSGSANLSRAALIETAGSKGIGNVEAGVLVELPWERMLAAFSPPDVAMTQIALSELVDIEYKPNDEPASPQVALRSASLRPDGSVEVRMSGMIPEGARFTNGLEHEALAGNRVVGPYARSEESPLVWITDASGARISNRVPLDDPQALRRFMSERDHRSTETSLLDIRDLQTPIGQMLERLHRGCIFDIDDTPAARSVSRDDQDGSEQDDFWERLLKEELRLDPRFDRYSAGVGHSSLPLDDDVFAFLAMMRDQVAGPQSLRAVGAGADPRGDNAGKRWSPEKRVQVRLFNVLDRWSRALSDPRLGWLHRNAPVRNYDALLAAMIECWSQMFLPEDRLVTLVQTLLGTFIRTERRNGYLLRLDDTELDEAIVALEHTSASAAAAALCYMALRPGLKAVQTYLFDWQAFIATGIERGFIAPNEKAVELVEAMLGTSVSLEAIEERLLWAATYLDDAHWCERTARLLELEEIRLTTDRVTEKFGVTLEVRGLQGGASDPRLVRVVRQALHYRRVSGAVVSFDDNRLSVAIGEPVRAKLNGTRFTSAEPLTEELIASLEQNGTGWDAVFEGATRLAS